MKLAHRRAFRWLAAIACVALLSCARAIAQPTESNASALGLALRRLGVTARVLYVTAHPDDENNAVLVALSRGRGVRTALLTLTRGEGGQNEIGPELFDALGVLRSEELAAVHCFDGAEQYFSRAQEFGFSFSLEETFERWGREATLADVVRVVRRLRPDVILTLPLEQSAGDPHAHHAASAQLAREAFRAAADPGRFTEQIREGLRPWQSSRLYQGSVGGATIESGDAIVETGTFDPLLSASWEEWGGRARASHRTQGMQPGTPSPGPGHATYRLVENASAGTPRSGADLFADVDTTLVGLSRFIPEPPKTPDVAIDWMALQRSIDGARDAFDARAPDRCAAPIAATLVSLRKVRESVSRSIDNETARDVILDRLADQETAAQDALALALGIHVDAEANDADVVPGQTFRVGVTVWNKGPRPIDVQAVVLRVPEGWKVRRYSSAADRLPAGKSSCLAFVVTVPQGTYGEPAPSDPTDPWPQPLSRVTLTYAVDHTTASLETPVVKQRALLHVTPVLSVELTPALAIVSTTTHALKEFVVRTRQAGAAGGPAVARLDLPAGWRSEPASVPLSPMREGEERTARFRVTPPSLSTAGEFPVRAVVTRGGKPYRDGDQLIAYPHVRVRHILRPAVSRVRAMDLRVSPDARIGYIRGAGDEVEKALLQLGVPVSFLSADDLRSGDLDRFTTIVTGIRAYQTRADLRSSHARVMDYVRRGGHLVVQYNKVEINQGPFLPYPAAVTSSRVTDEQAPIRILQPGHPLLSTPNALDASDWEGWVQERGLYLLETHDPHYTELLRSADPFPMNAGDKNGLLVDATVGKGTWTYVGLALFRQLPAGVPGAFRLLANLVSRPRVD